MYGKIHSEIFDSSLMAEGGWLPSYVLMCMITLSDKDGFLRHAPRTLYRKIGLNLDDRVSFGEFEDAVEFLQRPDDESNLPDMGGRRIIPIADMEDQQGNRGWFVVNKIHYRDKGGSIERRRANDAERQRRLRERKNKDLEPMASESNVTVTDGHSESAHTDTDTDTDKRGRARKRATSPPKSFPITDKMRQWALEKKITLSLRDETEAFLDYCRANGKSYIDWVSAWQGWLRRSQNWSKERNGETKPPVVAPTDPPPDCHPKKYEVMTPEARVTAWAQYETHGGSNGL